MGLELLAPHDKASILRHQISDSGFKNRLYDEAAYDNLGD